ncbi:hypothetical protein BJX68DRAFT_185750 [Aspergillus pseudodeflectus]|uniref:Uncharacterized protein n=1 Tax=Aspergillus pseudodeflectus TaxID=176178 RepID=A0ABR4JK73_9EURO
MRRRCDRHVLGQNQKHPRLRFSPNQDVVPSSTSASEASPKKKKMKIRYRNTVIGPPTTEWAK